MMKPVCLLLTAALITAAGTARYPMTVPVSHTATPAELTVIKGAIINGRHTIGDDLRTHGPVVTRVNRADLNGDGRPDLIINLESSGLCGSESGCPGYAIVATPAGFAHSAITLPGFGGGFIAAEVVVLESMHGGMHDLRFADDGDVFRWNGRAYR